MPFLAVLALIPPLIIEANAFVCPRSFGKAAQPIPNVVHQPWLGGATLRWEQVLAMMSVRYVQRPNAYVLYYDEPPPPSDTWTCAKAIVDATVSHPAPEAVSGRRIHYVQHKSDLMRIRLLSRHGGMYIDHDAYVLKPLDALRRCGADFIGGYEKFVGVEKINNGVLLARANATFLELWLRGYSDFNPLSWDHNSCVVPWRIVRARPELGLAIKQIGPMPALMGRAEDHAAYQRSALVVHLTGIFSSADWRRNEVKKFGVLRSIAARVLAAAAAPPERTRGGRGLKAATVLTRAARHPWRQRANASLMAWCRRKVHEHIQREW